ncbi:hypothetical protein DRQ26_07160 [bacterium]|nr:MAG: hypothetical protein DRQ26_07160 [bacterium]
MLYPMYEKNGVQLYLASKRDVIEAQEQDFPATYIFVPGKVDFISDHHTQEMNLGAINVYSQWISSELECGNNVVVYCQGGIERSALVVAMFLAEERDETLDEAYNWVQSIKGDVMRREYLLPKHLQWW